jgi:hypothetical protein
MAFRPNANLRFFKHTPTLDDLNGTFRADKKTHRAWAMRLKMGDRQKEALIEQAKQDGIKYEAPTFTGSLNTIRDRANALKQRMRGRVSHGWNARLHRPNPTRSGGTIEPEQLYVTQEKINFPGTKKDLPARVIVLFETELKTDKTLSDAKEIGKVISYELDNTFMLHRKEEAARTADEGSEANPASDPNKGRVLVITAHGEEPRERNKAGGEPKSMPLPDDMTLSYGVPSGYNSIVSRKGVQKSEIVMLAKEWPGFAAIRKIDKNSELAVFPRTEKFHDLLAPASDLAKSAADAKTLFRLAAGTGRAGHVADTLVAKFDRIRNAPDLPSKTGTRTLPPIVHTRGGDTYDQVAFAAWNEDKVDILTIRAGKKPKKSDLMKTLDKLGIRSQYDDIYDPSCRPPLPRDAGKPPRWDPLNDNMEFDELIFLKRTAKPGAEPEIVEIDQYDKDVRAWIEESRRNRP